MQKEIGYHFLFDVYDCDYTILKNEQIIKQCLNSMANVMQVEILAEKFFKFSGYGGISGVLVIAESHLSIHTWPEYNFASLDFFTCGSIQHIDKAVNIMNSYLQGKVKRTDIKRGIGLEERTLAC